MVNPIISVGIAITPPTVTLGVPCSLTISATLSSSYPAPITIYTWPTIFNLSLAQQRKNFFCNDLSDGNTPVNMEITKGGKRSGHISRERGSYHDQYWHTLEPGHKVDFTAPFALATRGDTPPLAAGHRYIFGISEGEGVQKWLLGTREEVLVEPGEEPTSDWQHERIELEIQGPVEFEVVAGP